MPWKIVCPHADCAKRFKKLDRLKAHMAEHHGGYSAEDIAAATQHAETVEPSASEPPNADASLFGEPESSPSAQPEERKEPVRRTRRDRDLNDKLNNCIDMAVERLMKGSLSPEREDEFSRGRAEIRNAMMGFEFNFEERLLKVSSKWVLLLVLVVLYLSPYAPDLKKMLNEASKATGNKEKAKAVADAAN